MRQTGTRRRGATGPTNAPLIDIDALETLIDRRVEARLTELGIAATEYSSGVRPQRLPSGVTARTFDRWCRGGRVEGAQRDGQGWRCAAAAWREARAQGTRRAPKPEAEPSIDAMLAASGLRGTR